MDLSGIPLVLAEQMVEFCGDFAWPRPAIYEVIDWCTASGLAVLGGDVLHQDNDELSLTGDSWYVHLPNDGEWQAFVKSANKKAIDYVRAYPEAPDGTYLFSLTVRNRTSSSGL